MKITLDAGAVMPTYAHDYDSGVQADERTL